MNTKINKSLILNEIKSYYNFVSDSEFAKFLGIKPQTLSSWHTRNTFDIELLYSKCENINAEYLLTGIGDIEKPNVEKMPYFYFACYFPSFKFLSYNNYLLVYYITFNINLKAS